MDIKKKLKELNEIEAEIREYFDGGAYFPFENNTEYWWMIDAETVCYGDDMDHVDGYQDEFHAPGGEVNAVFKKEHYTLINVRNGYGENVSQVFDNSKRVYDHEH